MLLYTLYLIGVRGVPERRIFSWARLERGSVANSRFRPFSFSFSFFFPPPPPRGPKSAIFSAGSRVSGGAGRTQIGNFQCGKPGGRAAPGGDERRAPGGPKSAIFSAGSRVAGRRRAATSGARRAAPLKGFYRDSNAAQRILQGF